MGNPPDDRRSALLRRIRLLLSVFIVGLVVSGATSIPLETELRWLARWASPETSLGAWLLRVRDALIETNAKHPFIAYGTDWLAFGHFVIAIAFVGPWRDPVENAWVVDFGMIACALIVPYALILGGLRGVPMGWRLIDISFGVMGIVPLWLCRRSIWELQAIRPTNSP